MLNPPNATQHRDYKGGPGVGPGAQLWERGIGESIGDSLKGTACGRPLEDGGVCNHPAGKGIWQLRRSCSRRNPWGIPLARELDWPDWPWQAAGRRLLPWTPQFPLHGEFEMREGGSLVLPLATVSS